MVVLLLHAGATCALAGLVWVVQLVVYPSFLQVGPTPAWAAVHAAHTRAAGLVVTGPWLVQGATTAVLLVDRPAVPLWLLLLDAALAATTVAVTALVSVPCHARLSSYDAAVARRLLLTNWARTAAWTGGAVTSLAMVGLA